MKTARQRLIGAVGAAVILAVAGLTMAAQGNDDENVDPGKHSAFTREQLRNNWPDANRSPLMVPSLLPNGAAEAPEVGFSLENVVTDPGRRPSRMWATYYDSDVLADGPPGASFRVFQRPAGMSPSDPCGPAGPLPYVERRVNRVALTICSSELSPASEAREYWETVTFTAALDQVDWLKG